MDLNGIRILEGNSLSSIKRQRKQNMQMFFSLTAALHFLPGLSFRSPPGFLYTQGQTTRNPRQVREKHTIGCVRSLAGPNGSVRGIILAPLKESGGHHAASR